MRVKTEVKKRGQEKARIAVITPEWRLDGGGENSPKKRERKRGARRN